MKIKMLENTASQYTLPMVVKKYNDEITKDEIFESYKQENIKSITRLNSEEKKNNTKVLKEMSLYNDILMEEKRNNDKITKNARLNSEDKKNNPTILKEMSLYNNMPMEISILEGYENGFSNDNNSITLRINTGKFLNEYLKKIVEEMDEIYNILYD